MADFDKTYKRLNNWFTVMFGIFIIFEAFMLGLSLGERRWEGVASNGILLLMCIGSLFILIASRMSADKHDVELVKLEAKRDALKDLVDRLDKKNDLEESKETQELGEILVAIAHDITGEEHRAPTEEELPKIEKAFHENTGKHVRLTRKQEKSGVSMEAELNDNPFPPRETKPKAIKKAKGESLDGIKKTKVNKG